MTVSIKARCCSVDYRSAGFKSTSGSEQTCFTEIIKTLFSQLTSVTVGCSVGAGMSSSLEEKNGEVSELQTGEYSMQPSGKPLLTRSQQKENLLLTILSLLMFSFCYGSFL